MVDLTALWLPIVLSAVGVFLASSVMHMVLTYHRSDYKKLPDEAQLLEALRTHGVTPGGYWFPHAASPAEMKAPEVQEKFQRGPVGLLTVMQNGPPVMGKHLAQWFAYCVVVGIFVAYLTGRTVDAGVAYLGVFRVAGTVAFLGYGLALAQASIWKGQEWRTTLKEFFDALVYGLLTAGVFGWLWP